MPISRNFSTRMKPLRYCELTVILNFIFCTLCDNFRRNMDTKMEDKKYSTAVGPEGLRNTLQKFDDNSKSLPYRYGSDREEIPHKKSSKTLLEAWPEWVKKKRYKTTLILSNCPRKYARSVCKWNLSMTSNRCIGEMSRIVEHETLVWTVIRRLTATGNPSAISINSSQ